MADRIGQMLGNYRLIRLLGRGGFADVYLGEHIHLNTLAAIKVLDSRFTSEQINQVRTEARIISNLVHPNITQIPDFSVEGTTYFTVMTYASNGNILQRHPSGSRLPPEVILPYVKQLASALQYIHDHELIHRDVKPMNILLGNNDGILLGDFGMAIAANRVGEDLSFGGTGAYAAPEQFLGQPCFASDQYALAVVVYEWLTGSLPFSGSLTELVGQHLSVPPPSLREKVPTIAPAVERVVFKALAKDPKQRFPDVQGFAKAFEEACLHLDYLYDVALSYAGEDRDYADALAETLRHRGLNVFYDKYEKSTLWGKNLYTYLSDVYQNRARYCVMFLSQHYASKLWTNHEREAAQARAFSENEEYILPVRLDATQIPAISPTVAYLSWPPETADSIADMIIEKLGKL